MEKERLGEVDTASAMKVATTFSSNLLHLLAALNQSQNPCQGMLSETTLSYTLLNQAAAAAVNNGNRKDERKV
jgi:hypothetical protein